MVALAAWEGADRVRIGKLRVVGLPDASLTVRSRVANILGSMDVSPLGWQPASVLIVRSMTDPMPGRIAPQSMGGGVDPAWEAAVREKLAALYRQAARPARAVVPSGASAVLFADEAELLATLVLDVVRTRVREFWWWRALLRTLPLDSPSALANVLRQRARSVPAAFELLARQDRAPEVVRALTPLAALAVLAAVVQAHDMSELAARLSAPRPLDSGEHGRLGASARASASDAIAGAASGEREVLDERQVRASQSDASKSSASEISPRAPDPVPPWQSGLAPQIVPSDLTREQACLLGVSLMLHHRPEVVRSARFATGLERWWHAVHPVQGPSRGADGQPKASADRADALPTANTGVARVAAREREHFPATPENLSDASASQDHAVFGVAGTGVDFPRPETGSVVDAPILKNSRAREAHSRDGGDERSIAAGESTPASSAIVRTAAKEAGAYATRNGEGDAPSPISRGSGSGLDDPSTRLDQDPLPQFPSIAPTASADAWLALEGGIDTELGGVLFLINLMCTLDLPLCFESEWELASDVGSWGVLYALGHALLASNAGTKDDPIWSALATLCRRAAGERLGAGLRPRAAFRLPAAWAVQAPADGNKSLAWAVHAGRLRVWSRTGYVVSDIAVSDLAAPGAESSADSKAQTNADRSAAVQAAEEAARFAGPARVSPAEFRDSPRTVLSRRSIAGIDRKLRRWLALVIPFLAMRLGRALGAEPTIAGLRDVLFARRGRLYVTSTHVDLVLPLSAVSLPVRLAGLDRSPGWLPEFGRVILFHFE